MIGVRETAGLISNYNLHDHISLCYAWMDIVLFDKCQFKRGAGGDKILFADKWQHENSAYTPNGFKYSCSGKQSAKYSENISLEYVAGEED